LIVETQKFNKLLKSSLGNVKPLMEMDGDDEFEMTNDDESSEYPTYEQFKDEIDDFFSNYGDYINPERLKQEVDMLLGFMNDDFEYIGEGNEERVDDDVSYEKKGSPLVTITVDGGDLIKAYLDNDYRYDYGVNSVELGGRFFFDENVYNDFINKN
jgi:hypothetical protein